MVVLGPPGRRLAREVGVVDADQGADLAGEAALLLDLALQRAGRRLAVVHPTAGQRPPTGVRGPRREAREQHLPGPSGHGVRRHPLHAQRLVVGQRLHHEPGDRHRAREHLGQRLPRGVDGRAVDLDHVRRWRVGSHPAVVDDPDGVGVHQPPVPRGTGQVRAVDVGAVPDPRLQPGLLVDLADQRGARVLAVVDTAAGERPELAARDPRRQPAQQQLDLGAALADHDGVRRHPLEPRQGTHGPQTSHRPNRRDAQHGEVPCRRATHVVPRVVRWTVP